MIVFLKATEEDAEALVKIQLRAFSIDVDICGDGPPGYDSVDRQIEIMKDHIYYKIVDDGKTIGGFYLHTKQRGYYELIRLYVDPSSQGKGVGCMALRFIEELFDDIEVLELEASDFRKDNHVFYENRGYVKIGEKEYFEGGFSYIYRKIF